jgi:hypothetical protein
MKYDLRIVSGELLFCFLVCTWFLCTHWYIVGVYLFCGRTTELVAEDWSLSSVERRRFNTVPAVIGCDAVSSGVRRFHHNTTAHLFSVQQRDGSRPPCCVIPYREVSSEHAVVSHLAGSRDRASIPGLPFITTPSRAAHDRYLLPASGSEGSQWCREASSLNFLFLL